MAEILCFDCWDQDISPVEYARYIYEGIGICSFHLKQRVEKKELEKEAFKGVQTIG
jgi:hypothetical protein